MSAGMMNFYVIERKKRGYTKASWCPEVTHTCPLPTRRERNSFNIKTRPRTVRNPFRCRGKNLDLETNRNKK